MLIKKYPEDFSIYYIGNLGDSDGRYYIEGSDESRRLGIDTSYKVKICNDMQDFDGDIDSDYYVQEAKKLVIEPY